MMSDPSFRRTASRRALILLGTLVLASAAREARATDLTDSNLLPTRTTPPYGTVTVIQKDTDLVEFTVVAGTDYYNQPPGSSFGTTSFTFNTDLALSPGDFTFVMPTVGCNKAANPSPNPFGQFKWLVTSARGAPTLVFDIHHAGATPSHFMIKNSRLAMFAANIGGFTIQGSSVTSHWVSNGGVLHLLLAGAAVGALVGGGACFAFHHRKRSRAGTPEVKGPQDLPVS